MLKRLLIVIFIAAAAIIVPYLVGGYIELLGDISKYGFNTWAEGVAILLLICITFLISMFLYSIGCLIYDYIIGKK